jgi:cytochrome o ubiquinol oxidase subunit 1
MQHYDVPEWHPWLVVAAIGAVLIAIGIALQVIQLVWSIRHRAALRDCHRRPMERPLARMVDAVARRRCSTSRSCPTSKAKRPYWAIKQRAIEQQRCDPSPEYTGHPHAAQQPGRLHLRVLRDDHGLRADLAHLVAEIRRPRAARTRRSSSFAWRDEHEEPISAATIADIDRANRSARREALANLQPVT